MGSRSKNKWKEELQLHQRKVQQSKDNFKSKRNQLIREHTMSSKKPIIGRRTLELQWEFYQFCNCFSMIHWTIKRINKEFLKEKISDFNQNFYVCGTEDFTKEISEYLKELGAKPDSVIFER